jgi:crotonobetainyl-CoA:carnitine CoA-transferase CaiB-like acyl-CoA transferase
MTLPLDGIKIVDFSDNGFVPSGAAALADFGADVIKVERPIGDPMRRIISSGIVPTVDGFDYLFELVNRNKRCIALDVESEEGREVFERLIAWADVYITNQLPRVREKLSTRPEDLFALNPKLVFARGHGQGQVGPDANSGGYDGVSFWARGGVAHVLTPQGSARPINQRPAMGDIPSGFNLAGGICAGLVHVLRTGKGIVVDTALLNTATWTLGPDLAYCSLAKAELNLAPPADAPPVSSPLRSLYKTKDDRFITLMMIVEDNYWDQACRAVELDELIEPYRDPAVREAAWPELTARFAEKIGSWTRAELDDRLRSESCIYAFFSAPIEVIDDPQVVANGYLMQHPDVDIRLSAPPVQFDSTPHQIRRAAPGLGEHNAEVLAMLGYDAAAIEDLASAGTVVCEA